MKKFFFGRVSKQLPAIVANEDGFRLKVVTVDTATDSVSFLCNIYQRDVITPGGSFLRDGRPVKLSISMELPDDDGQALPVTAQCHISYSRRISKEKCMIGMRYVEFENNSRDRLLRFISNNMAFNNTERTTERAPVCA